ncbi:unnamed protein product [Cunninghamella blakesleeana]
MPGYYSNLKDCINSINGNEKAWAYDIEYINNKTNTKKTSKRFIAHSIINLYKKAIAQKQPSFYEIIQLGVPVKLYFDLEFDIDLATTTLLKEEVTEIASILVDALKHIALSFPHLESDHNGIKIFHDCTPKKFSLHVINNDIIFDNSQVSCIGYVAEFSAFFDKYLNDLQSQNKISGNTWATLGSTKINKNRPLLPFDDAFSWSVGMWSFKNIIPNCFHFSQSLIAEVPPYIEPMVVSLSNYFPFRSPFCYNKELYTSGNKPDCMSTNGRFIEEVKYFNNNNDNNDNNYTSNLINITIPRNNVSKNYALIDDDKYITTEYNTNMMIRDLYYQQCVYCLHCESSYNNNTQSGIGVSSAKVYIRPDESRFIHCFNCERTYFAIEIGDQYWFLAKFHELINTNNDFLNYNDLDECGRITFVDAPMGTGKTKIIEDYINDEKHINKSLAALAEKLHLSSYLEKKVFNDEEKSSILAICLDSIWKVKMKTPYDIVILDEGTFVQYHFVAGTIKDKMPYVVSMFKNILIGSKKIIIMQHRIPLGTISFYCNILGIDPDDNTMVANFFFEKPTPLKPDRMCESLNELILMLEEDYCGHYCPVDKRSKKPLIIFCSRADYSLFFGLVPTFGDESATERIRCLCFYVQNEAWSQKFLTSPNMFAHECDVLIVASILQAGHNIEKHFLNSYEILFLGVLTFREELQLISRFRVLNNTDVWKYTKTIWIQKKVKNGVLKSSSFKRINNAFSTIGYQNEVSKFLSSVAALLTTFITKLLCHNLFIFS